MNKTKEVLITGFALFSMFFGAGNLILPPFLGKNAGENWSLVAIGFFITAVIIPILGILAHARLQGTMFDFGKKVSPIFSTAYCLIVYTISIALPAPRTASVTHEMAIQPYFNVSSLVTSSVYFILVFFFVINRSKVLSLLGKFLTPLIILILLSIIFVGIFAAPETISATTFNTPFIDGLLEGYQTFDAIGAVVVGGVLVISMNFNKNTSFEVKKELITKAGFIAGIGLFVIYIGLIYNGAIFGGTFSEEATRTDVLKGISTQTLGNIGTVFLSSLVALACFTTAVGIITGTADYFKGLFNNSQKAYLVTAIIGCLLGVLVGQFDVHYIIIIALPALMFIYPITIVLILLNVLPQKYTSAIVFKIVVLVTFIFSVPDFLQFIIDKKHLVGIIKIIPLASKHLGWVLPTILSFIITNLITIKKPA
ncbi:branched-chain amino acid ABC transporter substrate-binding protein [Tenacibaculum holothuriorum]|uniref:Branched-chain amino acid ABC transporter substrate-binding protein n=1 Tax=Tenacibaculum holothuriorum TaxID=1635173 RepID=A0A1Y2PBF5_9FLAO|nr:branched-chain amino acid transport system II carrier protein [Tenacibaculum holothuriorum]OSY87089.1 branched-chain amino acid ABC transporter substrate-binding protein [Tenacibaculum holothuriorum]